MSGGMKVYSLANMLAIRHRRIEWDGAWREAFGCPERAGNWIIYGKSGQGKTRFTLDLAKKFDEMGYRVDYATLEMGTSGDFVEEVMAAGIRPNVHRIKFIEGFSWDELEARLEMQRSPQVVFIDSLQYLVNDCKVGAEKLVALRRRYRDKIFIYISHVQGGEVEGTPAYHVKRDCFKRILVDGFRALFMGRGKGGRVGYYTIWAEQAEICWLNKNKDRVAL